jgi:hypothetical protein
MFGLSGIVHDGVSDQQQREAEGDEQRQAHGERD